MGVTQMLPLLENRQTWRQLYPYQPIYIFIYINILMLRHFLRCRL